MLSRPEISSVGFPFVEYIISDSCIAAVERRSHSTGRSVCLLLLKTETKYVKTSLIPAIELKQLLKLASTLTPKLIHVRVQRLYTSFGAFVQ